MLSERSLLFVARTRAREDLYISCHGTPAHSSRCNHLNDLNDRPAARYFSIHTFVRGYRPCRLTEISQPATSTAGPSV